MTARTRLDSNEGRIPLPVLMDFAHEYIQKVIDDPQLLRIPSLEGKYRPVENGHMHPNPELFIQVYGRGIFRFANEEIIVEPGEAVLVPTDMAHAEAVKRYRDRWCNLVFMLNQHGFSLHNAVALSNDDRVGRSFVGYKHKLGKSVMSWFDDVARLADIEDSAPVRVRLQNAALEGLRLIMRARPDEGGLGDISQAHKAEHCRILVLQHLPLQELSVRWLSDILQCSADYLSHVFHRSHGITLTDYINRERIDYATSMLGKSTMNISEIARSVGYSNPGYFSRQFKRYKKTSPRAYRLNLAH